MDGCRTCDLLDRRDRGEAPFWDAIHRSRHWDVVHCDGTSIEGWLVLVVRRHCAAVADLTDDEAAALGPLLKQASQALHDHLGASKTYVVQFAEHPLHRHVHVHVVPRLPDQPEDAIGPRIFEHLGVPEERTVPEARRDEIARALAPAFSGRSAPG